MAKQQTSLSQWLVSGATPPCTKAKVDSNTEDHHSLSEPSGIVSQNFQVEVVY